MKSKLVKEGLVLIAETPGEDIYLKKLFSSKGIKLIGKCCFPNTSRKKREELLLQGRDLWCKRTKQKTIYG